MKKKLNNRFTDAEKINLNNYITVNFQQINKMKPSVSWSDLAANIKKLIKITVTAPYLAAIFSARAKTVRTLLVKRPILNSTKSLSKLDTNTSLVTNSTKENKELKAAPCRLLTIKQAAAFFQVSERYLWNITETGGLNCVRMGRSVRYKMEYLEQYIDRLRLESINRNRMKQAVVTELKAGKPMPSKVKMVDAEEGEKKIYPNSDNQQEERNSDLVYFESGEVVGSRRD